MDDTQSGHIPLSARDGTKFQELKASGKLPSPAGIALQIMQMCRRDDVRIHDIAHLVQADPAMAARLLRLANSATSQPRRPAVSVFDAVNRIGLSSVWQVVLTFSLISESDAERCVGFDYEGFWSHSLATAVAAQALARRNRLVSPEECFTLGLLSDLGSLALASIYPERYAAILRTAEAETAAGLARLERAEFAIDNLAATIGMLADWGFPATFVNAVRQSRDARSLALAGDKRSTVVAASLALARDLGYFCVSTEAVRKTLLGRIFRQGAVLSLSEGELARDLQEIVSVWQEWGPLLKVPTGPVPSLDQVRQAKLELPASHWNTPQTRLPLRILVVDDNASMRTLISGMLEAQGHHLRVAENGRTALAESLRDPPHLVVTDWEMPDMDGLAFCRALRATSIGRQIYVIVVTGNSNEERLVDAFAAGADDYMHKPLRPRELDARIRAGQRFIELLQQAQRDGDELRQISNDLVIANRRLQYLAHTDALTALSNRRHLLNRLEQEFAASVRRRTQLAVMMLDIDHFKSVNDKYGHHVGDLVLQELSKLMKAHVRVEDTLGRIGGEEFAVVCPGTDAAGAAAAAERLRGVVQAMVLSHEERHIRFTVSIGLAMREGRMAHPNELLQCADQALYEAKRDGRNRVVLQAMEL